MRLKLRHVLVLLLLSACALIGCGNQEVFNSNNDFVHFHSPLFRLMHSG